MLVIASFSVRFLQSFFCLADGVLATKLLSCYWWYAANDGNYNTRRTVLIIFLIFNAVLNCLRNVDILTLFFLSHNNRKLINHHQSHLYQENSHWKQPFFAVLTCLVRLPKISSLSWNIKITPMFSDYFSDSFDSD